MKRIALQDVIGQKFGKLIIIGETDKAGKFQVICECGTVKAVRLSDIKDGTIVSCGCVQKENAARASLFAKEANIKSGRIKIDPKLVTANHIFRHRYSDTDLSLEEFIELSQQNCFYCDAPPSNQMNIYMRKDGTIKTKVSVERVYAATFIYNGLDRIDNNLPHYKSNIVPCCKYCNMSKSDRHVDDFLNWVNRIYLKKIKAL